MGIFRSGQAGCSPVAVRERDRNGTATIAAARVMGGRGPVSTVMGGRVIGIWDGMIRPAATRHRRVALKRQHQGEQQRESHTMGSIQPHNGLKHTTARGIIHATRAHLAVGFMV